MGWAGTCPGLVTRGAPLTQELLQPLEVMLLEVNLGFWDLN